MQDLPAQFYLAARIRAMERGAIEECGIPAATLMERAGGAAWVALRELWPRARRVVVLCGAGNNAGDGFVLARRAREGGLDVTLCLLSPAERLHGDARSNFERLAALRLKPVPLSAAVLMGADVLVDAIFGIGLDRPVSGAFALAIEAVNAHAAPVLAIDLPSGLDADSGAVMGTAVRADATLTFIALKRGLFCGDGPRYCGRLLFDDLGVPPALVQREPAAGFRT